MLFSVTEPWLLSMVPTIYLTMTIDRIFNIFRDRKYGSDIRKKQITECETEVKYHREKRAELDDLFQERVS